MAQASVFMLVNTISFETGSVKIQCLRPIALYGERFFACFLRGEGGKGESPVILLLMLI